MFVSGSGASWFVSLPKEEQDQFLASLESLSDEELEAWETDWPWWARDNQKPPPGDWCTWLLLAGRGFGKTRSGAECIRDQVIHHGRRRIALVAPTAADARDVMVEGESGLLAIGPPQQRPQYEPTKRRLTWPNGAIATTYSADEPERRIPWRRRSGTQGTLRAPCGQRTRNARSDGNRLWRPSDGRTK